MLPRYSSRQQQNRNVGTTNDQQRDYSREQEHQCPREAAQYLFVKGDNRNFAIASKIPGIILNEAIDKHLQLRCCGRMFHARFQLDEGHPVVMRVRGRGCWHIHVRVAPGETWGRYADDGIEGMVKLDGLPNDIPICTELFLPENITQDRDWRGVAARCIRGSEPTAHRGRHAHVREEIGGILTHCDGDWELATRQSLLPLLL